MWKMGFGPWASRLSTSKTFLEIVPLASLRLSKSKYYECTLGSGYSSPRMLSATIYCLTSITCPDASYALTGLRRPWRLGCSSNLSTTIAELYSIERWAATSVTESSLGRYLIHYDCNRKSSPLNRPHPATVRPYRAKLIVSNIILKRSFYVENLYIIAVRIII